MLKIKSKKKLAIILAVLLIVAALSGGFYIKNSNKETPRTPDQGETINFDPPTEEDAKRVDENKQSIVDREEAIKNNSQQPQPSTKSVKPVITYAGQYDTGVEVGGFTNGVFEDNSTCTATFSNGSTTFSKSVNAIKNVNAMDCPAIIAPIDQFNPKGVWNVSLKYSSQSASGESDARQIEIK